MKAVSPAFILTLTKLVIPYVEITLKQVMSNAMTTTLLMEMAAMLTVRLETTIVVLPLLHIEAPQQATAVQPVHPDIMLISPPSHAPLAFILVLLVITPLTVSLAQPPITVTLMVLNVFRIRVSLITPLKMLLHVFPPVPLVHQLRYA